MLVYGWQIRGSGQVDEPHFEWRWPVVVVLSWTAAVIVPGLAMLTAFVRKLPKWVSVARGLDLLVCASFLVYMELGLI
jgi:hypothetical protein